MTANAELLRRAAEALGGLKDEVVFVGGALVELYITDPAAPRPRFTQDVDVVVEVATYAAWARMGERLRALGFREDRREGSPVCRWLLQDLVLDVMPALERVLGFTNRWYRQARKQSEEWALPGGARIRVVTAPLFLATKIEAFSSRGGGDFAASHDLEDLIAVVDGRPALVGEVNGAPLPVRRFLATTFRQWLTGEDFLAAVPGHLAGDAASQARAPVVLERMREISLASPAGGRGGSPGRRGPKRRR